MKIFLTSTTAALTIPFLLLTGCKRAEPPNADVQRYIQSQLPAWLAVSSLEAKSFIDGNSGAGRTSVNTALVTTEPLFREASEPEIVSALSQWNLVAEDISTFNIPNSSFRRLFVTAYQKDSKFNGNTDLGCRAVVQGWAFNGTLDVSGIQGQPRSALPNDVLIIGTQEAKTYFEGYSARKRAFAEQKEKFFSWLRTYFAKGQQHEGAQHNWRWVDNYPFKFSLTMSADPKIVPADRRDEINLEAFAKLHWQGHYESGSGTENNPEFFEDQEVRIAGEGISVSGNHAFGGFIYMTYGGSDGKKYVFSHSNNCIIQDTAFKPNGGFVLTMDDERANEMRRTMLGNAQKLIVGTWRYENSLITYSADGTKVEKYNDGNSSRCKWSIDGDTLTDAMFEHNGRRDSGQARYQILELSHETFTSRDDEGKEWHAIRVK